MTTMEFKVTGETEAEMKEEAERELKRFSGMTTVVWAGTYSLDVTGTTYVSGQGAAQAVLYEGTVRAEW